MSGAASGPSRAPYALLAPFVILFVVFTLWPLVQSVPLSMSHTFGPGASLHVGWSKFSLALEDPRFYTALRNTLVFTAGSVFIQLPVALALAVALNQPWLRGRTLFRLAFFAPQLVGLVFTAVLARVLFQKQNGLANTLLAEIVGPLNSLAPGVFPSPGAMLETPWLEGLALTTLIVTALWMYAGFNMVFFLAALQNVSRELEEAATIDGAGRWARFRHVTIPAIRPVAAFVVLLSIIGSFQLFEMPYIMLEEGTGPRDKGLTLVTYLYKNGFEAGDLGYATAIGWLLALLLGGVAVAQRVLVRDEAKP
ncbi:MAG: sugar ABC transporter permease [Planctomycetota bacterium]